MTPADLQWALTVLGVVNRGGDFYCRCAVCQDAEDDSDRYRCRIRPGNIYPIVAFCFHCCQPGDRLGTRAWWTEFITHLPESFPSQCIRKATPKEIEAAWAEVDSRSQIMATTASVTTLDTVYSTLLATLSLSPRHSRWLQRRGVDPEWAFAAGYRSSTFDHLQKNKGSDEQAERAAKLFSQFGYALAAVPGFSITNDGRVQIRTRAPALLIPCRDAQGRIFCLKHRMTDGGRVRMRLLSSKVVGGPAALMGIHYPLGVGGHRWSEVWVTEGERKADVHWLKREKATIAVPGVRTWRLVKEAVSKLLSDGGEVIVAFDRDDAGRQTTPQLTSELINAGIRVREAVWDEKKGLDDAVAAGVEIRLSAVNGLTTTKLPPSSSVSDQRWKPHRLKDHEVVPYVRQYGPVLANELPAYPYTITRLVKTGELRVTFTPKGQLLRAP